MFQIDAELDKLTDKQRRFVYEYIACMKQGEAAIRAGYSAKTANTTGSKLLALGKIRRIVDHLLRERAKACEVDAEKVFAFFWGIVNSAMEKTSDKLRAAESCAKYTGGFIDRVEANVKGEVNITRTTYVMPALSMGTPQRAGKAVVAAHKEGKLVC